ncbi:MAG TPA: hypothetical protein PLD88_14480, partial [Candidatus Berkiella sp.]|nr:hypothetical protein [Candidatus Berkiella sp.]
LPPEYLVDVSDRPNWDEKCDIWQIGITIAEMLTSENYQAALKTAMKEQEITGVKKHLTLEQIQALMSDIFVASKPQPEMIADNKQDKCNNIIQTLREVLIAYARELTHEDRDSRPSLARLQEMQRNLRSEYLRVDALMIAIDPNRRYQQFKRQKTLLNMKANTSSSVPIFPLNGDVKKTQSMPTDELEIFELKKSTKKGSLRKSLGRLESKVEPSISLAYMESKEVVAMPSSDIVKRSRSVSSSKVHKKSQHVINALATATLEE